MQSHHTYDIVLVGGGVMSATLAALLYELDPTAKIALIERLDLLALESSHVMNNAGTGHSAFCELNYTPQKADGTVDISKAIQIAESFEISKQFWATLAEKGYFASPQMFINTLPHCSLVFGEEDITYLKTRYETLQTSPLFEGMLYSEDHETIRQRMPLIMQDRDPKERLAATYIPTGTDVNFGQLTNDIVHHLIQCGAVDLFAPYEVNDITKKADTRTLHLDTPHQTESITLKSTFVFLGSGGGALSLLQKSGVQERKQFGGFPVSGQRLVCTDPEIIAQHDAKVYGKASVGTPPMSVPHLDTRMIDGKKALLFGPYAGFTTRFLKHGSRFDLFLSLRRYNLIPMLQAGIRNIPLTRYLIGQVLQSSEDRLDSLRVYVKNAQAKDRKLQEAGYRVQVIRKDTKKGGILQFGTELVVSEDKTLATLLGASPGASISVPAMVSIIEQCFPQHVEHIPQLIPSYGQSLAKNKSLLKKIRERTTIVLG